VYNNYLLANFEKVATLEFTRDRKSMSVLAKDKSKNGNYVQLIKGAPDYLLESAKHVLTRSGNVVPLTPEAKKEFLRSVKEVAKKGLRTLAICIKLDVGELAGYNGKSHPVRKKINICYFIYKIIYYFRHTKNLRIQTRTNSSKAVLFSLVSLHYAIPHVKMSKKP
jgi:hypothetical protein